MVTLLEAIDTGVANSVVEVTLKGKDTIVSVITNSSVERLGLGPGVCVHGIVKASNVLPALP